MPLLFRKVFSLSTLALLTALTLSGIAAWYSILGLTAIFAAAVIPVIIMGGALELGKVVTTVWLHRYWDKASLLMKLYLVPAVAVLALITSMGIFGFLSKAHLDQTLPTGDVASQVQLLDEKIFTVRENIKTQRENIAAARAALNQLDNQVNARLDRGDSEAGAERAVQIRRQQQRERAALNREISQAQTEIENLNKQIADLNAEKSPIASQLRKVEAEVGPVKYIAALIYGDEVQNDITTLEKAVRWVIILLVLVFDPLALMLVIAAISSYKWEFGKKEEYVPIPPIATNTTYPPFVEEPKEEVKKKKGENQNQEENPSQEQNQEQNQDQEITQSKRSGLIDRLKLLRLNQKTSLMSKLNLSLLQFKNKISSARQNLPQLKLSNLLKNFLSKNKK